MKFDKNIKFRIIFSIFFVLNFNLCNLYAFWHKKCFRQYNDGKEINMSALARLELNRYQREVPRILKSREVTLPKFKKIIKKHMKIKDNRNSNIRMEFTAFL